MKRIAINCTAAVNIDLADLTPLQGNLKELSEINFKKLSDSILTHGVTFPFFVWRHDGKNWILDGTQRDRVLKKMADDGYDIPPLPCALIEAKDRREAAQKILLISSSYGRMTDEDLYEFLSENDIDFPELEPLLALDDIDLGDFKAGYLDDPTFDPSGLDDQGNLDRKAPVTCPECGTKFTP